MSDSKDTERGRALARQDKRNAQQHDHRKTESARKRYQEIQNDQENDD